MGFDVDIFTKSHSDRLQGTAYTAEEVVGNENHGIGMEVPAGYVSGESSKCLMITVFPATPGKVP